MTILVLILAAVEITLVALVIRTVWRCGAPAADARARKALAPPESSAAAPFAAPAGALARSAGRAGARYVGGRA